MDGDNCIFVEWGRCFVKGVETRWQAIGMAGSAEQAERHDTKQSAEFVS